MKQERPYASFSVSRKAEGALRAGHPWVYAEELRAQRGELSNGCIVDVFSDKGAWLGAGFYSEHSKLAVRMLSTNANDRFDEGFFARRVRYALSYRRAVMGEDFDCCRLIFGEADGLPGLTVDRFGDILVAQVLSYGMDCVKDMIYRALYGQLLAAGERISGVYERNESQIRELEGLPRYKGWYEPLPHPEKTSTEICENGIHYAVDFENGQKTGFFLDQKYNRLAVAKISRGRRVLDCFTHTGSFALNAALGGAIQVTAVDVSETAVNLARENAARNDLAALIDFKKADVFELLPELCASGANYDLIILDPPAFTKSRKTAQSAARGYKEINYRAMRLLPRGGYLATCSCSHFMPSEHFERILIEAARDAGVQLRRVEARQQSPDHPALLNVPETDYLKFYIMQVI